MLSEYIKYDGANLIWIKDKGRARKGDVVGNIDRSNGYLQFQFNGQKIYLHRYIYELHHGSIPDSMVIDHRDGNKTNNCITNLRLVTRGENTINRKGRGYWKTSSGNYAVEVRDIGGTKHRLGSYTSEQEASDVYNSFKDKVLESLLRRRNK